MRSDGRKIFLLGYILNGAAIALVVVGAVTA
jgi:hypothetical protein